MTGTVLPPKVSILAAKFGPDTLMLVMRLGWGHRKTRNTRPCLSVVAVDESAKHIGMRLSDGIVLPSIFFKSSIRLDQG